MEIGRELLSLSLVQLRTLLKSKEVSSVEVTDACLSAMEEARHLNAFITETPGFARSRAEESDKKLKKGEGGLLEGIPLAIKDLYCTKGIRTTAGSKMLASFVPPYESTVTQNLLNEGAVFLGKTNLDEFAMGSANITSYFGPVVSTLRAEGQPHVDLVPGGSSGGSDRKSVV
jgi:aspartyl-tRNA(Asn)/glutamyl-tRNA(Gln) amidotransferase subunit A